MSLVANLSVALGFVFAVFIVSQLIFVNIIPQLNRICVNFCSISWQNASTTLGLGEFKNSRPIDQVKPIVVTFKSEKFQKKSQGFYGFENNVTCFIDLKITFLIYSTP